VDASGSDPDESPPVEEILDMIGDRYARDVLAAVCRTPRSANDLAEELDQSIQTIYRRIATLKEYDLITSHTEIADDGNHYQVFESNVDSVLISVEDDEYEVRIYRREDLPDRFSNLWDELAGR
jgi:DNA-binding transcriptional ArsR family regulator